MIVTKTPLRIPLAGGLTDLHPYAERFGGVTVSSTIDKCIYVAVKHDLDGVFDLRYQDVHEQARGVDRIRHDLIREALSITGLQDTPLDISVMTDLPSESGLGSSGAVTVGLLHAMHRLQGSSPTPERLLAEASRIEVDILGGASGYHDPSICALGGLRVLEYDGPDVRTRPMAVASDTMAAFEASLMLFYSGHHAKSKPSLDLLRSHFAEAIPVLHDIKALGYALADAFERGSLAEIATCVGSMQDLKQRLPGHFEDAYVRDVVQRVRQTGAFAQLPGGKISAFVLVCCPDGQHAPVRTALSDLREVPFRLAEQGTVAHQI